MALKPKVTALEKKGGKSKPPTRSAANRKKLSGYLASAKNRLKDDKLTTPKGDSAYHYYHAALRIDPNNKSAKSGLKHIADRYAILTSAAISRYDHARASKYLTRGLTVDPSHKRLQSLKTEVRAINTPSKRFIKQVKEQPKRMVNKIENLLD